MLKPLMLKFCFDLSFPVLPGAGVWRSVPRARDADRPVLILLLLTQDHGLEDAGFWSPGTGGSQPEQSKLIVDLSS